MGHVLPAIDKERIRAPYLQVGRLEKQYVVP
jgi:hypothetical protein